MKGNEENELKTKEKDNNILCYVKWINNIFNSDSVLKVNWDNIEFEKSKKRKWKIKEREQIKDNSGNIISQRKSLYNIKPINNWKNKNEFKDDSENYNNLSSSSISEIGSEGEGNETENKQMSIKEVKKEGKICKNSENSENNENNGNKLYSNIYDNYNGEIQDIKFQKKKYIDYTALSSFINEESFSDESNDPKNEGRDTDLISYNIFEEIVKKREELDKMFFDNLNMHDNNDKEVKENVKNDNNIVENKLISNIKSENNNVKSENNNVKSGNNNVKSGNNNVKSENNNNTNLKLENDFDSSKKMENNNFCFWNMENETYITKPLYASQLKKKSYTLLDESEEMVKHFSLNKYSIKFVPRHLLYSVSQVVSRSFFDPLYRKQLFF
ncbi:hypothetical protein YYC_04887 [Plasmodium yoelii 17X]|uniref:Uncharacterized protein n=1 Tax=Plasmodium yoelii 17X TaxID=1323249 RepID=V7PE47_PLAYE|nr:hypothetical protein YYC_04887 [Plasmodium yoelii 17X]